MAIQDSQPSLSSNVNSETKRHFIIPTIFTLILLTICCVSLLQSVKLNKQKKQLTEQMSSLEAQVANLQEENKKLSKSLQADNSVIPSQVIDDPQSLNLPIVVYSRPGLLNNTPEGRIEKKQLEEKLIRPYIDYHNQTSLSLVALHITVPQNVGDEYEVDGILKGGILNGELFGSREGSYDYWKPGCMGICDFTEEFKQKYPQIVN